MRALADRRRDVYRHEPLQIRTRRQLPGPQRGTLTAGSIDLNGNFSRFNWSSGTLAVTGPAGLMLSPTGHIGPTRVVDAGKTLKVTNTLAVAAGGLLSLAEGGAIQAGALDLGSTPNRLNWSGGSLDITGPAGITIGSGGAIGSTFTVGAGRVLNVANTESSRQTGCSFSMTAM